MFLLQAHNVRNYGLSGATADRGWREQMQWSIGRKPGRATMRIERETLEPKPPKMRGRL
jgi:hypothetical protein